MSHSLRSAEAQCRRFLLAREAHVETFALVPTLRVPLGLLFLLSLIFLGHIKDGGYNSTNINRQLSPAQKTPALQATLETSTDSSTRWRS